MISRYYSQRYVSPHNVFFFKIFLIKQCFSRRNIYFWHRCFRLFAHVMMMKNVCNDEEQEKKILIHWARHPWRHGSFVKERKKIQRKSWERDVSPHASMTVIKLERHRTCALNLWKFVDTNCCARASLYIDTLGSIILQCWCSATFHENKRRAKEKSKAICIIVEFCCFAYFQLALRFAIDANRTRGSNCEVV